jgi:hypothetical protein
MTKIRHAASSLVLGTAVLGAALPAHAQGASPVTIKTCQVLQYVPTRARPFWSPFGPYPYGSPYTDGIRIAYVNHAPKAATRIAFVTNYRGDIQHIIDAGTFSQGATIDHTFGNYTGDAWLGPHPNSCSVAGVRFADGSVWRAAEILRQQAGSP